MAAHAKQESNVDVTPTSRCHDCTRPIVGAQLSQYVFHMVFDRVLALAECSGEFLVAATVTQQERQFLLADGEAGEGGGARGALAEPHQESRRTKRRGIEVDRLDPDDVYDRASALLGSIPK